MNEERTLARKALAEKAAETYTSGLTLMQVAEELNVSYGKAHALAKEGGARIRPRGHKFVPQSVVATGDDT